MKRVSKSDPFMRLLHQHKGKLTRQQFLTLRGQIDKGDEDGAMKGLARILRRAMK